jgi:hypothetical protein
MHVKEIYVIFIHLFDSGILLIIDLNKKTRGSQEPASFTWLGSILSKFCPVTTTSIQDGCHEQT